MPKRPSLTPRAPASPAPANRNPLRQCAARRLARFRNDEGGAILILGMMLFVLMLMVSGMAVDLMRYETMRTRLQNTLDSATLAAANLDQKLDPTTVVDDYFDKAGLQQYLGDVKVTEALNSRIVNAKASADVPSIFMQFLGINKLTAPGDSTAAESIGNVEISLVLDVSGSMNDNNKIGKLRDAAQSFVDQMFDNVQPGKLSISVIPYAQQVTAGPELFSYFNTTHDHDYSYCVDFQPSDFQTAALDVTEPLQQAGHFDPWNERTLNIRDSMRPCPVESSRYILPFSGSRGDLKTMIGNLSANGNTSIDVGVKWGAALLDPAAQSIVSDMVGKGELPSNFDGRPYAYGDVDAMKVLVVMTDGENTTRYELQPPYTSGPSPVYANSKDSDEFSFYDSNRGQYYWTIDDGWHDKPYGQDGGWYRECTGFRYNDCDDYRNRWYEAKGDATRLTWPQVWAKMSVNWFQYYIIYRAYNANAYYAWGDALVHDKTAQGSASDTQDSELNSVCTAAKNNHVTIYSIGFMASGNGKTALKKCATKDSYFYDVKNLDIAAAFASIANSINKLRLTE